jgi:hypothetical protein
MLPEKTDRANNVVNDAPGSATNGGTFGALGH